MASTVCGHVFCEPCIKASIETQRRCPTCRKKLTQRQYHPLFIWLLRHVLIKQSQKLSALAYFFPWMDFHLTVGWTEYWYNLLSVEYSFYVSCALRDLSRFVRIKITCTCVKIAGLHCLLSVVIDRQDRGLWMNF